MNAPVYLQKKWMGDLLTSSGRASRAIRYYQEALGHKEIKEEEAARYLGYIEIRKSRIPLQHITKEQAFMGYPFYVDEHVLIPRQDTETLVEEALKVLKPGMQVLDLCTGSGCILISLMKMCKGLYGTGSDISEDALEVARKNACRLEVNAAFIRSSLFEHISGR